MEAYASLKIPKKKVEAGTNYNICQFPPTYAVIAPAIDQKNRLKSILNHGTLLFGDVKGAPYAKALDQYLEGVKNRQSPKDFGYAS